MEGGGGGGGRSRTAETGRFRAVLVIRFKRRREGGGRSRAVMGYKG